MTSCMEQRCPISIPIVHIGMCEEQLLNDIRVPVLACEEQSGDVTLSGNGPTRPRVTSHDGNVHVERDWVATDDAPQQRPLDMCILRPCPSCCREYLR